MHSLLNALDALHRRARRLPALHRLAIISRILLALAFIPTGMVKLLGQRFTSLPTSDPVGAFFEAMYQTGFYWNFLGLGQVAAGILLLIPGTSTLGAVAYFPIVLNITVVTWSVGFKGTTTITSLMLLASLFLLSWDWDRLRSLVAPPAGREREVVAPASRLERTGYAIGTAAGLGVFLAVRNLLPTAALPWLLATGVLAALMVLVAWVQTLRRPAATAPGIRSAR
jgi:uncharacterized membrane protein YphA (DoxX/SURF4 family)